jgi:hypothetical protein
MHLGLVLAIGLATGALTLLGQKYLPDAVVQFANSFAVWLAASFLLGSLVRTTLWSLLGGIAVQFLALVGYYATSYLVLDLTLDTYNNALFWASGGLLGGPALGLAGFWWRSGPGNRAILATALLGATFISEGIYLLRSLAYNIGWAFVAVGVVLAITLAPSWRGRGLSLGLATAGSVVLFLLYRYGFGFLYDLSA